MTMSDSDSPKVIAQSHQSLPGSDESGLASKDLDVSTVSGAAESADGDADEPSKSAVLSNGAVKEAAAEVAPTPAKNAAAQRGSKAAASTKPVREGSREGSRRERKSVERLTDVLDKEHKVMEGKKEVFAVPAGHGAKLVDIEYVKYCLSRSKPEQLKVLHRLCFGRAGRLHETRRNLRLFCGFTWSGDVDAEESPEGAKLLARVLTHTIAELKFMLGLFGLELGGRHDELGARIVKFLLKPWDCGKAAPDGSGAQAKRRKSGSARRKSGAGSDKGGDDNVSSDDEAAEEGKKVASQKKRKTVSAPAKRKTVSAPAKRKTVSPSKKKKPDQKSSGGEDSELSSSSAASSSEDEQPPPDKKSKKMLSDAALRMAVKSILKGADLEALTMKKVTTMIFDKFPEVDLSSKKDLIKESVKKFINDA